jgi:hypothetical protein
MRSGAFIVIHCDAGVPFVLRPEGGEYHLICECYFHGIMFGEVSKALKASGSEEPHTCSFIH